MENDQNEGRSTSADLDTVLREQNFVPARVEDLDPPKASTRTLVDELYIILFEDLVYETDEAQRCVIPVTNKQAKMNGFHGSLPAGDFTLAHLMKGHAKNEKGRFPLVHNANLADIKRNLGHALKRRGVSRAAIKRKQEAAASGGSDL